MFISIKQLEKSTVDHVHNNFKSPKAAYRQELNICYRFYVQTCTKQTPTDCLVTEIQRGLNECHGQ